MATVEIRSLAHIRDFLGAKQFDYNFEGQLTVYELLSKLDAEFGLGKLIYRDDLTIRDDVRIFLRGRDAGFLEGEQLYLNDGDIVLIMPRLAGG